MKGFQERSERTGKFFVVKHYSICEESAKERNGFEPIEVTNPQTKETTIKFIKRYETLEAMVTKIEWRDTEEKYEQRYMDWKVFLNANGETGVLTIPFSSRVGSRFMKLAENIDFNKPVEFRAWKDSKPGKPDATAFLVAQGGESIPQRYTRLDPGDCPEPVQKFGGKWNFDDQMEYLHAQMMNVVIPKVEAAQAAIGGQSGGQSEPEMEHHPDFDDPNDPPF